MRRWGATGGGWDNRPEGLLEYSIAGQPLLAWPEGILVSLVGRQNVRSISVN